MGETEETRIGGDDSQVAFGQKFPGETVHCRNAVASSFLAEVLVEVFAHFHVHAVAVKRHSSMQN
jgi:hypothetical protein